MFSRRCVRCDGETNSKGQGLCQKCKNDRARERYHEKKKELGKDPLSFAKKIKKDMEKLIRELEK